MADYLLGIPVAISVIVFLTYHLLGIIDIANIFSYSSNETDFEVTGLFVDMTANQTDANRNLILDPLNTCILPKYDPWDKEVARFMNPNLHIPLDCDSVTIDSSLKDGRIVTVKHLTNCSGRCVNYKTDSSITLGPWLSQNSSVFKCDIVEVLCSKGQNITHNYAHLQIVEKSISNQSKTFENYHPSVYVILLDSVGHTQAIRSLPRTIQYFEKSMEGIIFPHFNKVGHNSLPNAYALWFGVRPEDVDRTIFGLPSLPHQLHNASELFDIKTNENFLFKKFNQTGYKTLFSEDWLQYAATFNAPRADHDLKPYFIHQTNTKAHLRARPGKHHCAEHFKTLLNWLSVFINAYKDQSKFGWLWINSLAHNDENGMVHADGDFHNLLINHREKLDNSFVVLMADHGARYGHAPKTKIGLNDKNNPFFAISVPKRLRETSGILNILKKNAKNLQTAFDFRATLIDIMKFQPTANFTMRKWKQFEQHGSSFLREQPGLRSCKTLPIPLIYCLCHFPTVHVDKNTSLAAKLGKSFIDHIMIKLKKSGLQDKCENLVYDAVADLFVYEPENQTRIYTISVKTKTPNVGIFKGVVKLKTDGSVEVGGTQIERLDVYGNKGDCAGYKKHLCFCRNINTIHKTTRSTTLYTKNAGPLTTSKLKNATKVDRVSMRSNNTNI